jgi:hypothetical protein
MSSFIELRPTEGVFSNGSPSSNNARYPMASRCGRLRSLGDMLMPPPFQSCAPVSAPLGPFPRDQRRWRPGTIRATTYEPEPAIPRTPGIREIRRAFGGEAAHSLGATNAAGMMPDCARRASFAFSDSAALARHDWASRAPQPLPNNFVHAEWITLHDNSNFRGFVDFLRTELDRVGPAHADLCRDFFSRAVALELSFFEAAYVT